MRKLFILICVSLFVFSSCNQPENKQLEPTKQEIKETRRFQMFPTENIWTFLKLDTSNGKIWQVQYSVNDNNRGEIELNNTALVSGEAAENGRFTLYQQTTCTTSFCLTNLMVKCGKFNGR